MTFSKNGKVDQAWIERVCQGKAIYDWNIHAQEIASVPEPTKEQLLAVEFRSECFRDALANVNRKPTKGERESFAQDLVKAGIGMITLDIFSSPNGQYSDCNNMTLSILEWMKENVPEARPVILARALKSDMSFLRDCYEKNDRLIPLIFQDLSEVRRMVEGWGSFEEVLGALTAMVKEASDEGMEVMAFTENLSITTPEDIKAYVEAVAKAGAYWIGIADTAGRLTPYGAARLTQFVRDAVEDTRRKNKIKRKIGIVFHGHNDWGNAISNSIAAIASGASVVDVVTNGVGERVGNTNLIELVVNIAYRLKLLGYTEERFNLPKLIELSKTYARITATKGITQQPIIGKRVFSTSFGIHGNYYYKVAVMAANMRDEGVPEEKVKRFEQEAWRVYSASSPSDFDLKPDIRVSQLSGASNVIMRLFALGLIEDVRAINKDNSGVQAILSRAKEGWGEMADVEITRIWSEFAAN